MIMEFSLKQLSWIVIGSLGIGGTGYLSMLEKIENIDKKVAVSNAHMDTVSKQLERIEQKLEKQQK